MATPIQDAFEENAASGVRSVLSDGEQVTMHSLDEMRKAAEYEQKQAAATNKRLGIKFFRVRSGGAAPQ